MKKILTLSLLVISSISYSQDCISDNPFFETTWQWTGMTFGCLETNVDPFEFDEMEIYFTSYDCCCQAYINIFPGDCNTVTVNEDKVEPTNGFYIDLLGNVYKEQPKGFSIMNGVKYYKF